MRSTDSGLRKAMFFSSSRDTRHLLQDARPQVEHVRRHLRQLVEAREGDVARCERRQRRSPAGSPARGCSTMRRTAGATAPRCRRALVAGRVDERVGQPIVDGGHPRRAHEAEIARPGSAPACARTTAGDCPRCARRGRTGYRCRRRECAGAASSDMPARLVQASLAARRRSVIASAVRASSDSSVM